MQELQVCVTRSRNMKSGRRIPIQVPEQCHINGYGTELQKSHG